MSLPFRTYAELLDRIEALAGKDSFTSNEQTRILSLANARLYSAYRRSDYWPRYLTVGEARVAVDGIVEYSQETAITVSGAGTEEVNGVYQPIGTLNGEVAFYLNGDPDGPYVYSTGTIWSLVYQNTPDWYYTSGNNPPWDETWLVGDGPSPAPTVTQSPRPDIDKFFRLYTGPIYGADGSGCELDFYTGNDGAHPTNTQTTWDQLYVTYKRVWDGPYTADSTEIPLEFFEFTTMGVLADWLRSNGNFEDGRAAEAEANAILDFEMMTKQMAYNARIYAPMFNTYISRQARNI